ncbi:hypothetical protein J5N97_012385 [Dioscorea zingiberensis]|uniref:TCP transcription factor n=1 Tax=Dioscorea zingiberensis TaxID=325984 RepID=A0A9D5CNU9_9LILI|nr:hypothetical protein J5N97_012385 [Dioscorea zingiberensis]
MLGFQLPHHQHQMLGSGDQMEGLGAGAGAGGNGSDSTDNYLRKRFREDLFKGEQQQQQPGSTQREESGGGSGAGPSSPPASAAKAMRKGTGAGIQLQQRPTQEPSVLPAAAMWAVAAAPAPTSAAFWMLPVSASSNSPTIAAAASEQPSLWAFPSGSNPYRTAIPSATGGSTIQAPLQFMSRINIPGGLELQGGRLPLGSMVLQQHNAGGAAAAAASQHLGLGLAETNLGMLAAFNAYNRGGGALSMSSEHHQHLDTRHHHHHQHQQHQQQQQQQGGSESGGGGGGGGEDHQTNSQ